MNRRVRQIRFFAIFGASFLLTYKGIQFLSPLISDPVSLKLPGEEWLPFIPEFIIIYLGAYLFIPFIFISLRRRRDIVLTIKALLTLTFINYIFFVLLPVQYTLRPPEVMLQGNTFAEITALFYAFDPPTNNYPSLHVGFSFLMFHATRRFLPHLTSFSFVMACLIALSTLFVKQHYVLDVVAGVLLSSSVSWIFFVRHWSSPAERSGSPIERVARILTSSQY